MPSRSTSLLLGVFVAIVSVPALPVSSAATPMLLLQSGATSVTVTDQVFAGGPGTAADQEIVLGSVRFNGALGAWTTNVTSGMILGTPTSPSQTLTSINVSSAAGAPNPLVLMFTEVGFIGSTSGISFFNSIGGTTEGTVIYQTFFSDTNLPFALTTAINTPTINYMGTSFSTSPPAGCCGPFGLSPHTPYSLTQVVTISHPGGTHTSSFSAELSGTPNLAAVPEPSSLILLGSGLLLSARLARGRRR